MTTPNLALTELVKRISKLTAEDLESLPADERRAIQRVLAQWKHEKLDQRSADDALYWAQNFTQTENPHWEKQGLPFKAPFPNKSYFVPLFEALKQSKYLLIPKSREMLTSWCCMAYAMHRAQWSTAEVIVQTSKQEKARRLVEYASILYRNQPDWLKRKHPLKGQPTVLSLEWESGGKLFGVPGGPDQVRMYHPTVIIYDEMCFMEDAEACWAAAFPVAQQMIGISSAAPGWMADQCS